MPAGAVEGPAAWYGAALAKREDWIYRLSAADVGEIDSAISAFAASGADLAEISPRTFPLPSFGTRLAAIANERIEGRARAVRGIPRAYSREEKRRIRVSAHFGRPRSQTQKVR